MTLVLARFIPNRFLRKLPQMVSLLILVGVAGGGQVEAQTDRCVVKGIQMTKQQQEVDKVVIALTGCETPRISALEGKRPRIVIDFPNGDCEDLRALNLRLQGNHAWRIRGAKHDSPDRLLRIVLDLKPEKSYFVDQTLHLGEGTFTVLIRPSPTASGGKKR